MTTDVEGRRRGMGSRAEPGPAGACVLFPAGAGVVFALLLRFGLVTFGLVTFGAVVGGLASPNALAAQSSTRVGGVGGWVVNDQIWQPETETEAVGGLILGAFASVSTPVTWFSVLAEGLYVQRGGDVVDDVGPQVVTGGVRSDFLTLTLHTRATARFGPASVHLSGGATIDQLIRSRIDPSLAPVLERESATVLGASVAVGVAARITEQVDVEVEARFVEGLGDALAGGFLSVRNRSKEIVARVGVPLPGR